MLIARRRTILLFVAAALVAGSACTQQAPDAPSPAPQPPAPATVTLFISTQPQSQTIAPGGHVTLTVLAGGNGSLTFQWYRGTSGATDAPIAGETSLSFATPALTETTSYWVKVSDSTGSVNSATATITVGSPGAAPVPPPASSPSPTPAPPGATPTPPSSTPAPTPTPPPATTPSPTPTPTPTPPATPTAPSIVSQPASQSAQSGQTVTLSVTAFGSAPLAYQWYVGSSGQTGAPISGATAVVYTTPALSTTTSYWVRVTNGLGSADSVTATITVNAPPPPSGVAPAVTVQPQSQTVTSGQSATLSVAASGTAPLTYQWYVGPSGSTVSPIGGAVGSSYTTPPLSTTTSYWVRVANGFGSADSATATITVSSTTGNTSFEDQVLVLINQQRAAGATCGGTPYPAVGPLYMNGNLRVAAQNHSFDMATQNYFSHTSLDGRTFDQRIFNAGYSGAYPLGENIAAGQTTPASVVTAWMQSTGHCTNIMNGSFNSAGVGYGFNASSTYFHYWTLDLGGS